MSTPHKCPVCEAKGGVVNPWGKVETCPACKGECVLWEPETVCIPSVWIGPISPFPPSPNFTWTNLPPDAVTIRVDPTEGQ